MQSCLHTQHLLVCERSEVIAFPAELCLYKPLRKDKDCSIQGCVNDVENKSGSCIMHKNTALTNFYGPFCDQHWASCPICCIALMTVFLVLRHNIQVCFEEV